MIHGLRSTLQEMRGSNSNVVIDCRGGTPGSMDIAQKFMKFRKRKHNYGNFQSEDGRCII